MRERVSCRSQIIRIAAESLDLQNEATFCSAGSVLVPTWKTSLLLPCPSSLTRRRLPRKLPKEGFLRTYDLEEIADRLDHERYTFWGKFLQRSEITMNPVSSRSDQKAYSLASSSR